MDHVPSEHDGRSALRDHAIERAKLARAKHGPMSPSTIMRLLDDRDVVRYPTGVRFDASGLEAGEFAFAQPLGEHPREGFCLWVHPALQQRPEDLPLAIAYHIPAINYGDVAQPDDCEAFGAALLGLEIEAYYRRLCSIADSLH